MGAVMKTPTKGQIFQMYLKQLVQFILIKKKVAHLYGNTPCLYVFIESLLFLPGPLMEKFPV